MRIPRPALRTEHLTAVYRQDNCINRREFAICTEKTCHSIGDFLPPRRPPSTKKLCRQSHRQSSEILIFYFGYWNIVLL